MFKQVKITNQAALSVKDLMLDADAGPSNLRFVGRPSIVTFAIVATAVTNELEVLAGERLAVERSSLEGGGTVGVYPNNREKGQQFFAAAGEVLQFRVRETGNVATTSTMMAIDVTPIG